MVWIACRLPDNRDTVPSLADGLSGRLTKRDEVDFVSLHAGREGSLDQELYIQLLIVRTETPSIPSRHSEEVSLLEKNLYCDSTAVAKTPSLRRGAGCHGEITIHSLKCSVSSTSSSRLISDHVWPTSR
jgi:hypothetical protein